MTNDNHGGPAAPIEPAGEQVKPELLVLTERESKRFWARVGKTSHPGGCWIWMGALQPSGYGVFQMRGKCAGAHRIVCEMTHGKLGRWIFACHECSVRNCVRPDHIKPGTPQQNVEHIDAKGRRFLRESKIFILPSYKIPDYPAPLDPSLKMTPKQRHRYECKIDRSGGPDACHPWTGAKLDRGYGVVGFGGKRYPSTQIAIRLYIGPMPKGTFALHRCDSPICNNHRHLWAGTQKENAEDREAKGRGNQPKGDKSGRRLHPEKYPKGDRHPYRLNPEIVRRGANHWLAINLTDEQMNEIRSLEGKMPQWQIGEKFGISETTVWRILRRNDWRSGVKREPRSSSSAG